MTTAQDIRNLEDRRYKARVSADQAVPTRQCWANCSPTT